MEDASFCCFAFVEAFYAARKDQRIIPPDRRDYRPPSCAQDCGLVASSLSTAIAFCSALFLRFLARYLGLIFPPCLRWWCDLLRQFPISSHRMTQFTEGNDLLMTSAL